MTATETIPFDIDAARRRRFDGGMPTHDDVDHIIVARIKFIANHATPERFCPRCTRFMGAFKPVCWTCSTEMR